MKVLIVVTGLLLSALVAAAEFSLAGTTSSILSEVAVHYAEGEVEHRDLRRAIGQLRTDLTRSRPKPRIVVDVFVK